MTRLKTIFFKGLLMIVLLAVAGFVLFRVVAVFRKLITPVAVKFGIDRVLGELTLTLLAVLVLLLLILLLGLLMQIAAMASFGRVLEDTVLKVLPSLAYLKTMAAEKLNVEKESNTWKAVMLLHREKYQPAFIIEELPELITFYVVLGTSFNDGEVLTIARDKVKFAEISTGQILQFSRKFGKGYAALVRQKGAVLL